MNDVKQIFETVLDGQEPPLAPSTSVIARAQRQRRRHHTAWVSASLVLIAVAAVAFVPRPSPVVRTASTQPPSTVTPDQADARRVIMDRLRNVLSNALPPTVQNKWLASEGSYDNDGITVVGVFGDVQVGDEVGQVLAYLISSTGPAPTGDLCAVPWTTHLLIDQHTSCQTVYAGAVPIRVGTVAELEPGHSRTVVTHYAARYLDGWLLVVAERPYNNNYVDHPKPMLTAPIFTETELAAVAANPAFIYGLR